MSRTAFIFPGQGSQHVGMAASFATHPSTKTLFTQANEVLGFNITTLIQEGDEATLRQTENAQPALLLAGIAALTHYKNAHPTATPTVMAGHSLGEYTALVAAGIIDFATGLKLVRARGEAMAAAGQNTAEQGGMSAVLGLEITKIKAIAAQHGVFVANDNADGQVILSGAATKLETATPDLKAAGAKRVLPLPVAGAFHTPLMQPAADKMAQILAGITFNTPTTPIILNTTATATTDADLIKTNLPTQIVSPVRWRETMATMHQQSITDTIEFGAGNVLTNLAKRSSHAFSAMAYHSLPN